MTSGGPAEARPPIPSFNPNTGASVGRTRPCWEKRFSAYAPAPAGAAVPGCHAGAWGPPSVGTSEG